MYQSAATRHSFHEVALKSREWERLKAERLANEREEVRKQQRTVLSERARLEMQQAAQRVAEIQAEIGTLSRYRHTVNEIERRACRVFGITKAELRSRRRHRSLVFARQFVMYWSVRLTGHSLPLIGRLMGGFDHTTVLHGKREYRVKRRYYSRNRNLREAR